MVGCVMVTVTVLTAVTRVWSSVGPGDSVPTTSLSTTMVIVSLATCNALVSVIVRMVAMKYIVVSGSGNATY